ncbi:MAG: hypothetical protein EA406_07540 [Rhodospirillales bacterium]|nr:MAG: hypothetical protein EA406_07540 [Rhodospirillales bacterium]
MMEQRGHASRKLRSPVGRAVLAMVASLLITACTATGIDTNPVVRKFTWFSYLNGDDIRAACIPGAPDRYRFVYNAVFVQHVRTYDIVPSADGRDFTLTSRVIGPPHLGRVFLARPADVFAPWRGTIVDTTLSPNDIESLRNALAAGAFFEPPPRRLRLTSEDFFWIGTACIDGEIAFNAYRWPSARFDRARFPELLLGWDPTGIPVNPPRHLSLFDIFGEADPNVRQRHSTFNLTVTEDGLIGR